MRGWIWAACAVVLLASQAWAAPPAALFTDPPADARPAARMEVMHIPSGGGELNAIAYVPSGPGPHPTVILFHGMPGNERNLDLAQTLRRAGWTVVAPNYRGSWGSPGKFSFKGNLDDAKAVLAYVRAPANAAKLQVDTRRIVIIGHSMGGWVTAMTAGHDPAVAGAVLISAADMDQLAGAALAVRLTTARSNMESLAITAEAMAEEMGTLGGFSFASVAPELAKRPLLVLSSDDGLAPAAKLLVANVRKAGGTKVTAVHVATDHGWNSARIRLETEILTWLAALP
jgi:uncharacterized protein